MHTVYEHLREEFDELLAKHGFQSMLELRSCHIFNGLYKQSQSWAVWRIRPENLMPFLKMDGKMQVQGAAQTLRRQFAGPAESAINYLWWCQKVGLNPIHEAIKVVAVMTQTSPSKNTYVLVRPTTVGKCYWHTKTFKHILGEHHVGSIQEGSFRFMDCPGKLVIVQHEVKFVPEDVEILKPLLRGDFVNVSVKFQATKSVHRTPFLLMCNEKQWSKLDFTEQDTIVAGCFVTER